MKYALFLLVVAQVGLANTGGHAWQCSESNSVLALEALVSGVNKELDHIQYSREDIASVELDEAGIVRINAILDERLMPSQCVGELCNIRNDITTLGQTKEARALTQDEFDGLIALVLRVKLSEFMRGLYSEDIKSGHKRRFSSLVEDIRSNPGIRDADAIVEEFEQMQRQYANNVRALESELLKLNWNWPISTSLLEAMTRLRDMERRQVSALDKLESDTSGAVLRILLETSGTTMLLRADYDLSFFEVEGDAHVRLQYDSIDRLNEDKIMLAAIVDVCRNVDGLKLRVGRSGEVALVVGGSTILTRQLGSSGQRGGSLIQLVPLLKQLGEMAKMGEVSLRQEGGAGIVDFDIGHNHWHGVASIREASRPELEFADSPDRGPPFRDKGRFTMSDGVLVYQEPNGFSVALNSFLDAEALGRKLRSSRRLRSTTFFSGVGILGLFIIEMVPL